MLSLILRRRHRFRRRRAAAAIHVDGGRRSAPSSRRSVGPTHVSGLRASAAVERLAPDNTVSHTNTKQTDSYSPSKRAMATMSGRRRGEPAATPNPVVKHAMRHAPLIGRISTLIESPSTNHPSEPRSIALNPPASQYNSIERPPIRRKENDSLSGNFALLNELELY